MGRGGGALPQASRTGHGREGPREDRGGRPARAADDGRDRRARARRSPGPARWRSSRRRSRGRRSATCRCARRARLEPARRRRRRRRARRPARGRARGGRGPRRRCSSPAAARRTPSASTAPAPPASAGFEFACAIPGTAGGGVRMNAGAYGSDWKAILVRALVVDAGGARWLHERGARPLLPPLGPRPGPGRRARSSSGSTPRPREEIKATVAEMQAQRKDDAADEQAHVRQRLQEPGPRARRGADDRALRAEGSPIGGALISPRHGELHRERRRGDRGATRSR